MKILIRSYKFLQLLSFDVALGSTILSMSIAHVFNIDVTPFVFFALFLCVWMIYTFDHLLDSRKIKGNASMDRHLFHQKNGEKIFYTLLVTACSSLSLLFFIPVPILLIGVITGGVVSCYFLLTWWLKVFVAKELLIAVLYSVGVCLAPFALADHISAIHIVVFVEIVLLALANLLLFSYFEEIQDRSDGYHSWATAFGSKRTSLHIYSIFLLIIVFGVAGVILGIGDNTILTFQGILLVMWLILVSILVLKKHVVKNELYRLWGDIIFMLPGILLLI